MTKYQPVDPVVRGSATPSPVRKVEASAPVLSAVVGDNRALIAEARRLWIAPNDIVADVTWGRGAFWPRNLDEDAQPQFRYDIATREPSVDCRSLPNSDNSIDVLVFDPPYRPSHGGNQEEYYSHYGLSKSGLDSMQDVLDLYQAGIVEAFRVLRPGGRILVKCQDMTYSDRLHLVHLDVIRQMQRAGFEFSDLFVLVNQKRREAAADSQDGEPAENAEEADDTQFRSQKRARRAHSYLLVGSKPRSK